MRINYILLDNMLRDIGDLDSIYSSLQNASIENNSVYVDEVVINLYVDNELLLKDCLDLIREFRFGILRRQPLVNLYFNVDNVDMIEDLDNNIQNFITPILQIDLSAKNIMNIVENKICLFKQKNWKMHILFEVKDIDEFIQSVQIYKLLKCKFFEEDFCILFHFAENIDLLNQAYLNMSYVMDTIKFLGMRNNVIVDCLLKAVREKETGISQEFNNSFKSIMKKLMQIDTEKYYEKKNLIRETMDDFAMQ